MSTIPEVIQWAMANPKEALASLMTVLGTLALVSRAIVKYAQKFGFSPAPGTFGRTVLNLCEFLGTVIPASPNDPAVKKAAEQAVDKVVDAKIDQPLPPAPPVAPAVVRVLATGEIVQQEPDAHPFIRRRIRAIAKRNGVDLTELGDDDIDNVIARAKAKAAEINKGPVRDFFAWLVANPQIILEILQLFVFAGPKANGAAEVSVD